MANPIASPRPRPLPIPPLSAELGTRFNAAVALARTGWSEVWGASVALALVWAALGLALRWLNGDADSIEQLITQFMTPRPWLLIAAAGVASLYLYLVMIARLLAVADGVLSGGVRDYLAALPLLPGAVAAALAFVAATTLGTLLFVVPGVYLSGAWQLWPVVLVAERRGALASLTRSSALVAGHWWRTTALVSVVALAAGLASLLASFVLETLAIMSPGDFYRATVMPVAELAVGVLLAPVLPAVLVLAFRERQPFQPGSSTT